MEIEVTALKKTYGSNTVLNNISLTIGNGMFGLLGRNGAGKTTLMQIMATLLKPSNGDITYNGIPLANTKQIRSFIGYLPQEFSFYPDLSVWETMRYLAALSNIPVEMQQKRIPQLLQQVNLWENRKQKVRKLSGGMKQRLGIAQALLNDPKVLIIDEPTVGLDPEERLRFYTLLGEFSSDRAVIVSSHIVKDIESVCENVAVLDAGQLLYVGTVEQLAGIAQGKVFELTVPKKEQAIVKQNHYILSSQGHLSDAKIRVLSNCIPTMGNPVSCTPTVEDGYMQLLRALEKGAEI
jgi:ABC-2 type transport system ATP-binding protein